MLAAPPAGVVHRLVGAALGLGLGGCAVLAAVRFRDGEGVGFLVGAGACAVLALEALVAAVRGRLPLVLRLGPLP